MGREDDILALALGKMLLAYEKTLDKDALAAQVRSEAVQCLLDISTILDREELSDFECIEEIVARMEKAGLGASRHDFG